MKTNMGARSSSDSPRAAAGREPHTAVDRALSLIRVAASAASGRGFAPAAKDSGADLALADTSLLLEAANSRAPNLLDLVLQALLKRAPGATPSAAAPHATAPQAHELHLLRIAVKAAPSASTGAPFAAVVTARVALRASAAWLSVFSRRLRYSLLQARSVSLSDRAPSLALLRAPSQAAQLAALAAMPAERAAGLLACMEAPQRKALLAALDATQCGAELGGARPKAAAAKLSSFAPRLRADVVAAMPRIAAAATMRAMNAAVRAETMAALQRDAREALAGLLRSCE